VPEEASKLIPFTVQSRESTHKVTLEHTFIDRCNLLDAIIPTYIIMTLIWLGILIASSIHSCVLNKRHCLHLQRSLLVIPAMKAMESLINSLYLDSCPWVAQTNLTEKYIDMARISIVTFAYTILLAFLYLLSKGWQTLQF